MGQIAGQVTLERGLRAAFVKAFDNGEDPQEVMPYILETSSDGADEKYGWLGQSPNMEEWIDERQLKGLIDFDYTLTNKPYEATISVNRDDMEDDRLSSVKVRINDLAGKARIHPRKLFIDALEAGTTDLCYDGVAFFSASHVEGDSGTQSNLLTGTGVTYAQIQADFEAAEVAMKSFLDDRGQPHNESEIKIGIVCHPTLKAKFVQLNTLEQISSSSNAMKGRISSIVDSARFSDVNDWYFANIAEGIKPIIRQVRQKPRFEALEGKSSKGFMSKQFHYGVDSREVFGYGLWQRMIKTTNS